MPGIDAATGRALDGWAHVEQSLADIFTTRLATRVMRRTYGSDVLKLQDAPATDAVILEIFSAWAEAIYKWEPRFLPVRVFTERAGPDGVFKFVMEGFYFPRGHLGDFTSPEQRLSETSILVGLA
jgi:phage baseplate assembly protein W